MNKVTRTKNVYSLLWKMVRADRLPSKCHFNEIQELIPEPIIKGVRGIDIGSGCGHDTYFMAKSVPSVKILSLDISDGIYKAKEFATGLRNVWFVKGSVLSMPIKDNIFDFAYSFGVLHHLPDPEKGVREIANVIKEGAPVYLYLYEDHSENYIKYLAIKFVSISRTITTKIPAKMLYVISYLTSPVIAIVFTYPSMIFKRFKCLKSLANKIPFNFGTYPFSLAGDLYDRFSAPIEHRFSKKEVFDLLSKNGFTDIKIGKLKTKAGWVVWGYKQKC